MYWGKRKKTKNEDSDDETDEGSVLVKNNHIYFI